MWEDKIVDEVRKIRDEHASKFNYDIDAIINDLIDKQKKSGYKVISFVNGKYIEIEQLEKTNHSTVL